MEVLTVYDAFNRKIGTADREKVHREGLWHRSINFIVVDPVTREVLFQDPGNVDVYSNPDYFVKMNGGHILDGEEVSDGFRELEEELGLSVSPDDALLLGTYQVSFEPKPDFINREFMYFYLVPYTNAFRDVAFKSEEVKSVSSVSVDSAIRLLTHDEETCHASVRDSEGTSKAVAFTGMSFKNFTDDSLYLRLFLAVQDYLNGRDPKYIVI